jgi:hypothetical protein
MTPPRQEMGEEPCILVNIDFAVLLEKAMRIDHNGCEEEVGEVGENSENEEGCAVSNGEADRLGKKSRILI